MPSNMGVAGMNCNRIHSADTVNKFGLLAKVLAWTFVFLVIVEDYF